MGTSTSRPESKTHRRAVMRGRSNSEPSRLKKSEGVSGTNTQLLSGRKFLVESNVPYPFPVDWIASDTCFLQHITMKNFLNGNYTAPLAYHFEVGSKILDIGCGAGNWCIEMAQEFEDCNVYGIDLTSRFPIDIKPKNCKFIVGDVVQPLPFEDKMFDFVYIRNLFAAIRTAQWVPLLTEVRRILKPGGILEHHEIDAVSHDVGPTYDEAQQRWRAYFLERDLDASYACRMKDFVAEAGFVNIESKYVSIPQGKWGGKLGGVWAEAFKEIYVSLQALGPQMIGWTKREYEEKLKIMFEKEIEEYKTYSNHYIVVARKP